MKKLTLNKRLIAGLALAGTLAVSQTAVAVDRGELLANTCAGCHGPGGNSVGPATPSISNMSKDYFIESMAAYAMGDRPSTIMTRIAKGYTDEEIELMGDYFAKQPFIEAQQDTDSKMVSKGQKIHNKYCEKCHSEGGSLQEDDAGILAGQWKPYLTYNLHDFVSGNREAPKKMAKALNKVTKKYGDKGIEQLIEYYSSASK